MRRRRPLGGGEREFLALHERVTAADPTLFTALWTDPAAYYWSRLAYEAVGDCLKPATASRVLRGYRAAFGDPTPEELLRLHLGEFKRFALGAAWLAGEDLDLAAPLPVDLPFALPGTPAVLAGRGRVEILGLRGRELRLASGQAPLGECPVASSGDVAIALNPAVFNLPGIEFAPILLGFAGDFQAEHRELVQSALELVRRHSPEIFEHFTEMTVLALKEESSGDFTNLSYSDLPGAAVCTVLAEPYSFAETLIHELHHDRLFFVEEDGRFLVEAGDPELEAGFYSPWREDLRPLHGLLHAVYVFIPVWRFWRAVNESGEARGALRDLERDQLVRIPIQLAIGVAQLERHARFTGPGAGLFAELRSDVEAIRGLSPAAAEAATTAATTVRRDGTIVPEEIGPTRSTGSVRDSLLDHLRCYDRSEQCGELVAELLETGER